MKLCLVFTAVTIVSLSGFSQSDIFYLNPFTSSNPQNLSHISLAQDTDNSILFLGYDSILGANFLADNRGALTVIDPICCDHQMLVVDRIGRRWVTCTNSARLISTDTSITYFLGFDFPGQYVVRTLDDNTGGIWAITVDSVNIYANHFANYSWNTFVIDSAAHFIADILCDHSGALLISVYNGPFKILKFTGTGFSTIYTNSQTNVITMALGQSDSIYIASPFYFGLNVYNGITWNAVSTPFSANLLTGVNGLAMFADRHGHLFFRNIFGYFFVYYNGSWSSINIPESAGMMQVLSSLYPNVVINNFISDETNEVWINLNAVGNSSHPIAVIDLFGLNQIAGKVFIDANANGIKDVGESGVPRILISESPYDYYSASDTQGNYHLYVIDSGAAYSVACPPIQFYHFTTPSIFSLTPANDSLCCRNFGLTPDGNIQNLQIAVTPGIVRVGHIIPHWINYQNSGTISVSDTVSYQFDSRYAFVSSSPPPDLINGTTLKWAFQNLRPFEIRNISLLLQLTINAQLADTLHYTATVNPLGSDTTPADNFISSTEVVVGSYDPNEKTVSFENGANASDGLTYCVYFQNTGTDTAFTVIIRDTLDSGLDITSLKILGSSHPMGYNLKGSGIIEFKFMNILLPDSNTNEPLSHGFVKYSIKPQDNLNNGTIINNTASIYFDFNTPVVTNTTSTIIGLTNILEPSGKIEFCVYPNPNSGAFAIELKGRDLVYEFSLEDVMGRKILSIKEEEPVTKISINTLPPGIYLLSAINNSQVVGRGKVILK